MPTYGDGRTEYPYSPEKRKKQKYTLVTRVIDFAKLPVTSGVFGVGTGYATTAWALADVLEVIKIRAGQTVLGVQVEVLTISNDSGDFVTVGYGDDTAHWGKAWVYQINRGSPRMLVIPNDADKTGILMTKALEGTNGLYGGPVYFATADTVDITIGKASLTGKIRLIVHLLEDDR